MRVTNTCDNLCCDKLFNRLLSRFRHFLDGGLKFKIYQQENTISAIYMSCFYILSQKNSQHLKRDFAPPPSFVLRFNRCEQLVILYNSYM